MSTSDILNHMEDSINAAFRDALSLPKIPYRQAHILLDLLQWVHEQPRIIEAPPMPTAYNADDDGHMERQGHVQEMADLSDEELEAIRNKIW